LVSDAIERIRKAEAKAESSARDARARAKELVAEARQSQDALLDSMRKEVRDAERRFLEQARSTAEAEADQIRKESRGAVERVKKGADGRVGAAVQKVLSSISVETS